MNISETGLDLIRHFEGYRQNAYICPGGKPTIGYGHVILPDEEFTEDGITRGEADDLLRADCERFERAVERLVRVPLTQDQFDALVSFAFNLGAGALEKSTLLRRVNASSWKAARREFRRWVYAGGSILDGLRARRLAEAQLFLPYSSDAEAQSEAV